MKGNLIEALHQAAQERCARADENRERGIPDPLNDLVDTVKDIAARGETLICKPPRKSKKHKIRKSK